MKKLLVIRGPLGVGKTTVSKILSQKLNREYLSVDSILDDNHLVEPNTDGIPLESYLKANEIIFDTAARSANSFVVDGCFYYKEQIDDLLNKFDNDAEFITLTSTVDACIERDSKRPKVYGEDAARFVHMITTKIQAGHTIDNTGLTPEQTVEIIMEKILL